MLTAGCRTTTLCGVPLGNDARLGLSTFPRPSNFAANEWASSQLPDRRRAWIEGSTLGAHARSSSTEFDMSNKVFVGGLSWNTTDNSLLEAFRPYGEIVEAKVVMDRDTGRSRGFGFVTFQDPAAAKASVA